MILKVHIFVLRGRKEKGCKKISKAGMFSNSGITALHKKRKKKKSGIIASFYWWCLSKCIQDRIATLKLLIETFCFCFNVPVFMRRF
jgi:diacylglycerol kinase